MSPPATAAKHRPASPLPLPLPPPAAPHERPDPVTVKGAFRLTRIILAAGGALVPIVWYALSLKSDITACTGAINEAVQHEQIIQEQNEKRLTKLETKTDQQQLDSETIKAKVDVGNAILERLDRKLGNP